MNDDRINNLLAGIRKSEGENFIFDEPSIKAEYKKAEANQSSLIIKVLSIFGGLLGTLAFFGFLVSLVINSDVLLITLGLTFIVVSVILNSKFQKLIIDTFLICLFGLGFFMLGMGFNKAGIDSNLLCLVLILLSALSIILARNFVLNFVSVLIINGSLLAIISINEYFNLIHLYAAFVTISFSWWSFNEARIVAGGKLFSRLYEPVLAGLIFSLISCLVYLGIRELVTVSYPWISSIFLIPIVIYMIPKVLKLINKTDQKDNIFIYFIAVIVLLPMVFAPAISGSLIILLISFYINHKVGIAAGIICLIFFIAQYYYDLEFSLLTKSAMLFGSGILFVIIFLLTNKKLSE